MEIREHNTSSMYPDGSRWETNHYGTLTIIGQCVKLRYYKVLFDDYGFGKYITYTQGNAIKKGIVRNKLYPTVYNKGCIGVGPHIGGINRKHTREYKLWSGVIQRCFSESFHMKNPTYKGCSVEQRWLNFQNFCDDLPYIEGYCYWLDKSNRYQLDKDIKYPGNKVYSKDTCLFVSMKDNITKATTTGKTYKATRISDSYEEVFVNQTRFGLKYGLSQGDISACLTNKQKTSKGWKFSVVEEGM